MPPLPTTEEHVPPTSGDAARGRPVLLAAFPVPAALPLPPLDQPAGRAWLADAGLTDPKVSGHHFRLHRARGQLHIEDTGSRNGTWIDGQPQRPGDPAPIEDGDVLRLGGTLLVYREAFEGPLEPQPPLGSMVGPFGLGSVRAALATLAARPARNVLIEGETGAGKELVARAVVRALGREARPFSAINVVSIAPSLFEGHLFGTERGAFSGSVAARKGVLRDHDGGTVFLDEIGELPLDLQPKLLRVLENGEVLPAGASRPVPIDVALIAATNRTLDEQIERGAFRRDLLARFLIRIAIPPLRDRPEDLFAIAQALWQARHGALGPVEVEAVERMMLHDWPANVRDVDRLIAALDPAEGLRLSAVEQALGRPSPEASQRITREAIERALGACDGNKSRAAKQLRISRGRLLRMLNPPKRS